MLPSNEYSISNELEKFLPPEDDYITKLSS